MYQYNFWRFWHFFGETNHLPCAESLRPILSLTNLKTSSAAALGSNSICYTYFFYYQSIETELTRLLILFWAFFDIFWPDKSLTLCGISEANFGLDQLKDLICSCAGIKLYGVELAIHEVESSIDGPSVDRTQDLLFGGWPLSSPCSKCLVKTLKVRIQYAL